MYNKRQLAYLQSLGLPEGAESVHIEALVASPDKPIPPVRSEIHRTRNRKRLAWAASLRTMNQTTRRPVGFPMRIRYYYDEDSGLPHIYQHGVREAEVEEVFGQIAEDRPGRDGSRVALGRTNAARCLRVIYVPDPEQDEVFVITACELEGKPLAAFRRRRRRKRDS